MGKIEVRDKLRRELEREHPFSEEKDVVYFLVETRKILDHLRDGGENRFRVLRFYCDWTVHTRKDNIISEVRTIMDAIARESTGVNDEPSALTRFIQMERLGEELQSFNQQNELSEKNLANGDIWDNFRTLLRQILSDQPIVLSGPGITKFRIRVNDGVYGVEYDVVP